MLSGQYRSPINYSDELLEQAKNGLDRLRNTVYTLKHRTNSAGTGDVSEEVVTKIEAWKHQFIEAMDDDFNTADAISVLFELSREINTFLRNEEVVMGDIKQYTEAMLELSAILGLELSEKEELLDSDIDSLIQERNDARKNKNFARADEIRDLLTEKGIVLEDTPQGVRWRRK